MKFFIPAADSPEQAERVLAAVAQHVGYPVPSKRIYSVSYVHNGQAMTATVGEFPDPYYRAPGPVVCILETPTCLAVCTHGRGVGRGDGPIYVGRGPERFSGVSIKYFEDSL